MHMKKRKVYLRSASAKRKIKNFQYYLTILVLGILITRFSFAYIGNNMDSLLSYSNSASIITETINSQNILLDYNRILSPTNVLSFQMPFMVYKTSADDANSVQVINATITADDSESDDSESNRVLSEKLKTEIINSIKKSDVDTADLSGKEPKVLIYQTHTNEAYEVIVNGKAVATTTFRSTDHAQSVVAVGDALAEKLENEYGIVVIHDKTDHEPPYLGTAYERSLATMEKYKKLYPSIEVFIDIHRDGFTGEELLKRQNDYVTVDGKQCAKIMLVVGNGQGSSGQGFSVMPKYQENYVLAKAVTDKLNAIKSGFAKSVLVKTGRYNQHVSTKCMLIEVGHNGNTIEQAVNTVPYIAEAIYKVLSAK